MDPHALMFVLEPIIGNPNYTVGKVYKLVEKQIPVKCRMKNFFFYILSITMSFEIKHLEKLNF